MNNFFLALKLAYKNIFNHLGRTFVTLSGVILSVMAIVIVMSMGESVKGFILDEVGSFGTDVIQIEVRIPTGTEGQDYSTDAIASMSGITTMTVGDAEAIQKLDNVEKYYAGIIGQSAVQYQNEMRQFMTWGSTPDILSIDQNIEISEGNFYTEKEEQSATRGVVLGSEAREQLFGNQPAVGEKVKIKGQSYRVLGVLKERGASFGLSFDEMVYMPLSTTQTHILGVDHVSFITAQVGDTAKMEDTAERIRSILRSRHDIDDPKNDDFEVMSIQEAQDLVNDVFGTVTILLIALASISLIVGGVGIMNVMFVSLEERTPEIGLRKALGARSSDILQQFMIESMAISLFGGIMGIVFGLGLVYLGIFGAGLVGFELVFALTVGIIITASMFALLAGLLFGVYPAYRASKIDPIEAISRQ